ncbi:TNR18 factor, partial [Bombycilla garrulus]|nr:TNR18 factor [Bombycilla garrulus]
NPVPCEAQDQEPLDDDCKCPPGHSCGDKSCQFCRELPPCEPGYQPVGKGEVYFEFECEPCKNGSYSSSRNSWCRNWTDCESSGFITLRAGNSTHNSVC